MVFINAAAHGTLYRMFDPTRRAFLRVAAAGTVLSMAPRLEAAPANRPNILLIVADDMGFSDAGCYGGEIATPNLDRLAASGLRFTQCYSTGRCWPSRSCLLTGYYPQQIHMDPPRGRLPEWTRLLPHHLKPLGYRCYHSGKWHILGAPKPMTDGGFDHSYKIDDHDRYFTPRTHQEDEKPLPAVKPEDGYYSTTFIADHAIKCLKEHARLHAAEPFFEYLAFLSPHFPLQALQQDIDSYRDRYLEGWDKLREERYQRQLDMKLVSCSLSPRDPGIIPKWNLPEDQLKKRIGPGEVGHAVAWEDLTPEQKRFQATKMAIHAAMIDRMDREIGRVLDQLVAMNAMENTIILFVCDNGASAEQLIRGDGHDPAKPPGSAGTFLSLGPGWATSSNTPFRLHKSFVHEGGVSSPLIVHWPAGITGKGEMRHDVAHFTDVVPTLLQITGAKSVLPPEAPPLPGISLASVFDKDGSTTRPYVYFNHEGHHALRVGDWKVVALEDEHWELYNLSQDRSEQSNQATARPEMLQKLSARWHEIDDQFQKDAGPIRKAP
jgi:arylsulfatase A-like enzyme